MRPGDDEDTALTDIDDFDTWHALQKATDTPRANIIADIVGHPKGAPSVREHESRLRRQVTLREVSIDDVDQITLTRLTEYYERILSLSKLVLVGDAKWKTEVKNNDVYQVVAYQTAYDAPCVRVYPDNDGALQNDYPRRKCEFGVFGRT